MSKNNKYMTEKIEELGDQVGDEIVVEMINIFIEDSPHQIRKGRECYEKSDLVGVTRAIHPLKSSSGDLGVLEMQELSTKIESLAKKGRGKALDPLLTELGRAFEEAKQYLNNQKKRLARSAKKSNG